MSTHVVVGSGPVGIRTVLLKAVAATRAMLSNLSNLYG